MRLNTNGFWKGAQRVQLQMREKKRVKNLKQMKFWWCTRYTAHRPITQYFSYAIATCTYCQLVVHHIYDEQYSGVSIFFIASVVNFTSVSLFCKWEIANMIDIRFFNTARSHYFILSDRFSLTHSFIYIVLPFIITE